MEDPHRLGVKESTPHARVQTLMARLIRRSSRPTAPNRWVQGSQPLLLLMAQCLSPRVPPCNLRILLVACRSLPTTCLSFELPYYATSYAAGMLLPPMRPSFLFQRSLPLLSRAGLPRRLITLRILNLGRFQLFQHVFDLVMGYLGRK